ncbi:ribosome small subunit-dependent GTPase A [Limnochorda pilosa]|uniref:Small ribosomal subunit biogenesis GTPase RsgA n=1 Tax=Limnochorda pilosa TaxID=1555112 RepID=A0A0K2SM03_LIMPI|nr:ribosome small subunit-dependent GTPase A [Limnochorda pilosa]BAS27859.1 GTPase RsgA [Limnochorda pilosa]
MSLFDLRILGWGPMHDPPFETYRSGGCEPARVAGHSHDVYTVLTAAGSRLARVSGRYRHQAATRAEYPVVGDWVALRGPATSGEGVIEGLLPRRSAISRKAAAPNGKVEEQVLAANVDTVFLVSSLNREFNPRRIERYLITAWESGADPVVVLNKADLCADPDAHQDLLGPVAAGVPVFLTSAATGRGLEALAPYLGAGRTVAFLGSSGVGKSSLINRLAGRELQATGAIRDDDDRGRHTTTRSDLILLPGGALLVDTPGLRELAPWSSEEGLDQTFADIAELARGCRFSDCRHEGEPECSVQTALDEGRLSPERLAAYRKLRREQAFLRRKQDQRERLERQRWGKQLAKATRQRERSGMARPKTKG